MEVKEAIGTNVIEVKEAIETDVMEVKKSHRDKCD